MLAVYNRFSSRAGRRLLLSQQQNGTGHRWVWDPWLYVTYRDKETVQSAKRQKITHKPTLLWSFVQRNQSRDLSRPLLWSRVLNPALGMITQELTQIFPCYYLYYVIILPKYFHYTSHSPWGPVTATRRYEKVTKKSKGISSMLPFFSNNLHLHCSNDNTIFLHR